MHKHCILIYTILASHYNQRHPDDPPTLKKHVGNTQATHEIKGWDWRGRRQTVHQLGPDEEDFVKDEGGSRAINGNRDEL